MVLCCGDCVQRVMNRQESENIFGVCDRGKGNDENAHASSMPLLEAVSDMLRCGDWAPEGLRLGRLLPGGASVLGRRPLRRPPAPQEHEKIGARREHNCHQAGRVMQPSARWQHQTALPNAFAQARPRHTPSTTVRTAAGGAAVGAGAPGLRGPRTSDTTQLRK